MTSLNIIPNIVTFSMLVDTICKESKVSEAQSRLKTMTEMGVESLMSLLEKITSNSSDSISSSSSSRSITSREKHKKDDASSSSSSFINIDDALACFNHMLHGKPRRPCIIQFNKLLSATVRMRHYENVLSLTKQMEFVDAMCKSGNLKLR